MNSVSEQKKFADDRVKHKIMRTLFILSFTVLPVAQFLVMYVYVNLDGFLMAFQKAESGKTVWAGLENFEWVIKRIFQGAQQPRNDLGAAFLNTLKTFAINLAMFFLGIFVAYFIYKKIPGYKTFRVLFYLPSVVSAVVVSFFFRELMSSQSFFPKMLQRLYHLEYLPAPLQDTRFANQMVFLHMVWLGFPGNLIIWGGTFARIPDSVVESARIDGVNWVQEMFRIVLPMVWPTLVLLITMSFAGCLGASGAVFLLTGGDYGTQTVSNWIYQMVVNTTNPARTNNLHWAAALGLMMTVVSCALALFIRFWLNKKLEAVMY